MNNRLVESLFANLASSVMRGVGQAVAAGVVSGVLGALGIENDENELTSDSQNKSDSNSESVDENTKA